jgi:hypothetical protein
MFLRMMSRNKSKNTPKAIPPIPAT